MRVNMSRREAIRLVGATAAALSTTMHAESRGMGETASSSAHTSSGTSMEQESRLVVYPFPDGAIANHLFEVRVRSKGGDWKEVIPYRMTTSDVKSGRAKLQDVSAALFDFTGAVDIEVAFTGGPVESVKLRPLSYEVAHRLKGNVIEFSLSEPRNLSLEVNGDIFHNLHIFAGLPESKVPTRGDKDVIFFGPGVHKLSADERKLASGQTVYLSGGAIVQGGFLLDNVEHVRIIGRGMMDQTRGSITVKHSKDIEIEGILTAGNIQIGQSENVTIRHTKAIRSGQWGDGIDVFCCKNVVIEDAFLRTSDDCIAIYGHRWDYDGDVDGVKVSNCTLWADIAHPVLIGTHGNTEKPNALKNISFRNIDILDQHEEQLDYQGCLSINAGDSNLVQDVLFQDIRIENFRLGQLVNLRVFYNKKYNTSPGRGIVGVTFRNITYSGSGANVSVIAGYDETRKIQNVTFENLVVNGTTISDTMHEKPAWYKTGDMANIFIGEHVEGLSFVSTRS